MKGLVRLSLCGRPRVTIRSRCRPLFIRSNIHVAVTVTKHNPPSHGNPSEWEWSSETASVTAMTDQVLEYTRRLMRGEAEDDVQKRHHVIAFSGGVDSSLVAALVHLCAAEREGMDDGEGEEVYAVLGMSPAVPQEQVALAHQVAQHIGISLKLIRTTEGQDETYIANAGQACLACKTNLYSSLQAVVNHVITAQEQDCSHGNTFYLYNGTNADDGKDPTRLGLIAAQRFRVRSPLEYLSKENVRKIAKHLGLFHWNYAASPCLRSRLALGVPATMEHLRRIEMAERHVRQCLALAETESMRVRFLAGNRACIEVESNRISDATTVKWDDVLVHQLGFQSVSIREFRSGSVATKQPPQQEVDATEHEHESTTSSYG